MIILHADPQRGGAERYTWDLAAALRGRGHDVSLLASSFGKVGTHSDRILLSTGGATRAGRYRQFLDQLDEHLSDRRYDVIHAMLPVRRCDVYHPHAGIAADAVTGSHPKRKGRVVQAIARTALRLNRRRQMFAAVERALLTAPAPPITLCLSEYVKGFVCKHYDLPPEKLATLLNGVNLNAFDPFARPSAGMEIRRRYAIADDKVVALMIAQDFERKGLREAILALSRVGDPRVVLLVAGKQDPAPYRQLAGREGVGDRVVFAGPTSDAYAFYPAADFFILPTRHDPCSLVVLEALAMGLPVISTIFNGACEAMTSGTHGLVLSDPKDVPALAAAIGTLLDDGRRKAMSDACLQLRPALSYDHHLDELLRIYRGSKERS